MWAVRDESLLTYVPSNIECLKRMRTVIGFDFDGTLVTQKSGEKYPTDENDWKPLNNCVKKKLIDCYTIEEKIIVLFSNQSGVGKNKITIDAVKSRFNQFIAFINDDLENESKIPFFCYIALKEDHNRKPSASMWYTMIRDFTNMINKDENDDKIIVEWDFKNCLYVGDAAGRVKDWKPKMKKDFACSDRKFAHNASIDFKTPEEFYFKEAPGKWEWDGFDPRSFLEQYDNDNNNKCSDNSEKIEFEKESPCMILLVGPPASGKSTFCKTYFPDCKRINRDELKTIAKCKKEATDAIKNNQTVIIDNTNGSKKSRKEFIDLAKLLKIKVKCVVFDTPKELATHLNNLRVKMTEGKTDKIPSVVYNTFFKYYEEPSVEEGICEIVHQSFRLNFQNEEHKRLFLERS